MRALGAQGCVRVGVLWANLRFELAVELVHVALLELKMHTDCLN